jgi:hypothetical protein
MSFGDMIKLKMRGSMFECSPSVIHLNLRCKWVCSDVKSCYRKHSCQIKQIMTNMLLQPIKRQQPFDLVCADYLSLPRGKGGWKTVLLTIDMFSDFVWAPKLRSNGSGKASIEGLNDIVQNYNSPETYMADGGSHFKNEEVTVYCEVHNIQTT